MVIQKELEEALNRLIHEKNAQLWVGETRVGMKLFDEASKLFLSTRVFIGEDCIPKSVRKSLMEDLPYQSFYTYLSIDESTFSVHLNYVGKADNFDSFEELLEEFACIADIWRSLLEDHRKRELIYIYKKK